MTERKILFRGFHLDENGKTTITLNGNKFNGDWLYWNKWGECINIENGALILLPAQGFECLRVNKFNILCETIGQWVKTDKSGKDVFEGDIVKCDYSRAMCKSMAQNSRFIVSFHDCAFKADYLHYGREVTVNLYQLGGVELCGNVWESEVTE